LHDDWEKGEVTRPYGSGALLEEQESSDPNAVGGLGIDTLKRLEI
jgi:hypothetical protein